MLYFYVVAVSCVCVSMRFFSVMKMILRYAVTLLAELALAPLAAKTKSTEHHFSRFKLQNFHLGSSSVSV